MSGQKRWKSNRRKGPWLESYSFHIEIGCKGKSAFSLGHGSKEIRRGRKKGSELTIPLHNPMAANRTCHPCCSNFHIRHCRCRSGFRHRSHPSCFRSAMTVGSGGRRGLCSSQAGTRRIRKRTAQYRIARLRCSNHPILQRTAYSHAAYRIGRLWYTRNRLRTRLRSKFRRHSPL